MKSYNYVKDKSKNNIEALQESSSEQLDSETLNKYRKILEQDGKKYTDEEILTIYGYLKEMAKISVSEYLKRVNNEKSNINVKSKL